MKYSDPIILAQQDAVNRTIQYRNTIPSIPSMELPIRTKIKGLHGRNGKQDARSSKTGNWIGLGSGIFPV